MRLFPAIDLFDGKAVRLYKGDYNQMTVYNENPSAVAADFKSTGAKFMHIVDLEGAKNGVPANTNVIKDIIDCFKGFVQVGGGIRSPETVKHYVDAGVDRIILGTAAVNDKTFLVDMIKEYGEKIAVGVDIKDGYVAIKGWTEVSGIEVNDFFAQMQNFGVKTIICTDILKDGAMQGTNLYLYKRLSDAFNVDIIASGGVSTIEDIKSLAKMNLYGAIIGKAYYTGSIDLKEAIEVAKC